MIIGIPVGHVGPQYFAQIGKSEVKAVRARINALGKALNQFQLDNRHDPNAEERLAALVQCRANEAKWEGP